MTRSILTSELFAALHAFRFANTIETALHNIFGKTIPLVLHTDWNSVHDDYLGQRNDQKTTCDRFVHALWIGRVVPIGKRRVDT